MTLTQDLRHGCRIARAEFTRSVRGYTRDTRRLVGIALLVVVVGGQLLFTLPGVYLLGRRVRSVSAVPFLDQLAVAVPLGLLILAVLRTVERVGGAESEALLLTTVHPRAVVVGLALAEVSRLSLWFGLPILVVSGVFAAGLGTPSLVVTAGLVSVPLVCCTAVWGYAVGLGGLRAIRRLPTLGRLLKAGGIVVLFGLVLVSQFVGQYVAEAGLSLRSLLSVVQYDPLTAYVGLAFLGTPLARPVEPSALFVLAGCLVLAPLGLAAAERQASRLWFTDGSTRHPADGRGTRPASEVGGTGGFSPPRPFSLTKAGRIAWGFLLRARRKPQRLVHLSLIVFFLGPFGTTLFNSSGDGLLAVVAGMGVVLGVYLSGAAFNLNPLGDEQPQLPLVYLTQTAPSSHLRGRIGAGLTLGLPVATLVPLGAFALSSSPLYGLVFGVAGVGWCVAGALFALGLGCAYPIFEEREMWGVETVTPSTLVSLTYTVVVVFGTIIGLLVVWYLLTGHVSLSPLVFGGISLYLAVLLTTPATSYLYAVRRYRRYTVG